MRDLNFAIKTVVKRNRDGSYATRANRARMLDLCANQLHSMGFRDIKGVDKLRSKHIHRLVELWKKDGVTVGSMKNRMAALRWLAEKGGIPGLVAASNDHYDIDQRVYVTNTDRSTAFEQEKIDAIADRYVQASALLQREFGLRREEAMKFIPRIADQNDHIALAPSWCKGGRAREVPVRTEAQRAALDHAREVAGLGSLIPGQKSYKSHMKLFEAEMTRVGLSKTHGARHAYAQQRYREETGRECPARGGKKAKQLTPEEKTQDRAVRLQISQELGHGRESITAVYLGR